METLSVLLAEMRIHRISHQKGPGMRFLMLFCPTSCWKIPSCQWFRRRDAHLKQQGWLSGIRHIHPLNGWVKCHYSLCSNSMSFPLKCRKSESYPLCWREIPEVVTNTRYSTWWSCVFVSHKNDTGEDKSKTYVNSFLANIITAEITYCLYYRTI